MTNVTWSINRQLIGISLRLCMWSGWHQTVWRATYNQIPGHPSRDPTAISRPSTCRALTGPDQRPHVPHLLTKCEIFFAHEAHPSWSESSISLQTAQITPQVDTITEPPTGYERTIIRVVHHQKWTARMPQWASWANLPWAKNYSTKSVWIQILSQTSLFRSVLSKNSNHPFYYGLLEFFHSNLNKNRRDESYQLTTWWVARISN